MFPDNYPHHPMCAVSLHIRSSSQACRICCWDMHSFGVLNRLALRLSVTLASADFSQFVILRLMDSLARPHGISPESFLVYPLDLQHWVTVAFWTSRLLARSSASVTLLSSSYPLGHDLAMASSPLYLAVQSLPFAIVFAGNYAP